MNMAALRNNLTVALLTPWQPEVGKTCISTEIGVGWPATVDRIDGDSIVVTYRQTYAYGREATDEQRTVKLSSLTSDSRSEWEANNYSVKKTLTTAFSALPSICKDYRFFGVEWCAVVLLR
jgi:hypothetical protein